MGGDKRLIFFPSFNTLSYFILCLCFNFSLRRIFLISPFNGALHYPGGLRHLSELRDESGDLREKG